MIAEREAKRNDLGPSLVIDSLDLQIAPVPKN